MFPLPVIKPQLKVFPLPVTKKHLNVIKHQLKVFLLPVITHQLKVFPVNTRLHKIQATVTQHLHALPRMMTSHYLVYLLNPNCQAIAKCIGETEEVKQLDKLRTTLKTKKILKKQNTLKSIELYRYLLAKVRLNVMQARRNYENLLSRHEKEFYLTVAVFQVMTTIPQHGTTMECCWIVRIHVIESCSVES